MIDIAFLTNQRKTHLTSGGGGLDLLVTKSFLRFFVLKNIECLFLLALPVHVLLLFFAE